MPRLGAVALNQRPSLIQSALVGKPQGITVKFAE
jgi:hypothetical protein